MIRNTLGRLLIRIGEKLTPQKNERLSPTERYISKLRKDFKKKRFIDPATGRLDIHFNPLAMDEEINCPCHYGAPSCGIHPLDEEEFKSVAALAIPHNHKVAKIEWPEEKEDTYTLTVDTAHTFAVSAGAFVKNSNDEDFFIPQRDVA